MGSFASEITSSRGGTVFLVSGGHDYTGQQAWFFVRVDSPKLRVFRQAIASGAALLQQYGEILESGYGQAPPPDVIDYMRSHHGYTA